MEKINTVCFSGPRTERLPQSEEAIQMLEEAVYEAIDAAVRAGFNTFIHGACYGFDLLCAEQILMRRRVIKPDDPREIRVVAAIPFEDQAARWKEADRDRYFDILKQCDEVITLNCSSVKGIYDMGSPPFGYKKTDAAFLLATSVFCLIFDLVIGKG